MPAGNYFISYTNTAATSTAQVCPNSTATCYRYYNAIDSNGDIGASLGSASYNHMQRPWYTAAKARFAANPVSSATAAWTLATFASASFNVGLTYSVPFSVCSLCGPSVRTPSVMCALCASSSGSSTFSGAVSANLFLSNVASQLAAAFPDASQQVWAVDQVLMFSSAPFPYSTVLNI